MAMKKIFALVLVLISVLMVASCEFEEVDFGYPKTVTFLKDGGEKVVTGATRFTDAHIHDYKSGDDGNGVHREDGVECETYKWLKIEYVYNSTELKIIAEPNTTGKSRKLHIELYSGPEYHVIKVEQQ